MNSAFWNEMYANDDYAYGTKPNDFLASVDLPPNKRILCLAEGQGRNAVYLASQGHQVSMIDYSEVGLQKANALADKHDVHIETILADLANYDFESNSWDVIVIIFGHFPESVRTNLYPKLYDALAPNGILISETYSKEQIKFQTGGPKDPSMMASEDDLKDLLSCFESLNIISTERMIQEGSYHSGLSSVIQVLAKKSD
jgi:SAM-dependent methyltransferase